MALVESYAIWNNKGGVGKSTITFHVASRYAELFPDRNVLVIDLCPQANSSMMLLGGGITGETRVLQNCVAATPVTVVGYLSQVISSGSGAPLPDPMNYVRQVSASNNDLPSNLFLLCGDGNLEPMGPAIVGAADAAALTPQSAPWKWVHSIFRRLIDDIVAKYPDKDWMVFVDTNPSFSIYTELAISAVNKLISPVNADDSSRVATNAMFILLHGQNPPHPIYGAWTYATKAKIHQMHVPTIHLVIGNRLTQYDGAADAFAALSDATADTLYTAFSNNQTYFTARPKSPTSVEEFREKYSIPLRDFNTAGVVSAHLGRRLSGMNGGIYTVHNSNVQVNKARVLECLDALDKVIHSL